MDGERLKWIIDGLDFPNLTEWEEKFVISIEEQFQKKGSLTGKQEEMIEKIYKEKGR